VAVEAGFGEYVWQPVSGQTPGLPPACFGTVLIVSPVQLQSTSAKGTKMVQASLSQPGAGFGCHIKYMLA